MDTLTRLVVKDATITGHVGGEITLTGYVVHATPSMQCIREILRPVCPEEPDSEVEVAYSKSALRPLTLVYRGKEVTLTLTPYLLFRYAYDLYRSEGQTEFTYAELSEAVTGDELALSKYALDALVRRLHEPLKSIDAPFTVAYLDEEMYIREVGAPPLAMKERKRPARLPINRLGRCAVPVPVCFET